MQVEEIQGRHATRWCEVCGANFEITPRLPHDCREHLGALIQMREQVETFIEKIGASSFVKVISMTEEGEVSEETVEVGPYPSDGGESVEVEDRGTCSTCEGSGLAPNGEDFCPVCDGTGKAR